MNHFIEKIKWLTFACNSLYYLTFCRDWTFQCFCQEAVVDYRLFSHSNHDSLNRRTIRLKICWNVSHWVLKFHELLLLENAHCAPDVGTP